ncbi:kinase-like protein [Heliocybe sulcata]|uniref:Kinase-like protein n=1 Tax=Heliocybe sulcata TaxID=5364 RepID=A0A5C3N0C3_9AGAM|nr:kinase-like protein [Heliocybe sulcata]
MSACEMPILTLVQSEALNRGFPFYHSSSNPEASALASGADFVPQIHGATVRKTRSDFDGEEARLFLDNAEKNSIRDILKTWGRDRTERYLNCLLKTLQEWSADLPPNDLCKRGTNLLVRLALDNVLFPPSLFVTGIRTGKSSACAGGFGDVHKGTWNGYLVAVKRLREYNSDTHQTRRQRKQTLFREAIIWCSLKHRNILPLIGVSVDDPLYPYVMVSPWLENGDIVQYIKQFPSQTVMEEMLREVAEGLSYIHERGLVHGDIRGVNILPSILRRYVQSDRSQGKCTCRRGIKSTDC